MDIAHPPQGAQESSSISANDCLPVLNYASFAGAEPSLERIDVGYWRAMSSGSGPSESSGGISPCAASTAGVRQPDLTPQK